MLFSELRAYLYILITYYRSLTRIAGDRADTRGPSNPRTNLSYEVHVSLSIYE